MESILSLINATTGESGHKNDRIVYVRRAKSFLERTQNESGPLFTEAKIGVGPYFEKNTTNCGSGLSYAEQILLLPKLLNIAATDREFRKEVDNFYAEFYTAVPHGEGRKLNIGLEEDNNAPVSETNFPIQIADYIRYRHVLKHPWTAKDELTAKSNSRYQYFVYDPSKAEEVEKTSNEISDMAMKLYLELKDTRESEMVLAAMGVNLVEMKLKEANFGAARQRKLKELCNREPARFATACQDSMLETRYLIRMLLDSGIIMQIASAYIDPKTSRTLANGDKEMLVFMNNPANNSKVSEYKMYLQDKIGELATRVKKAKKEAEISEADKKAAEQAGKELPTGASTAAEPDKK